MTPIEEHIKDTRFILIGQVVELLDTKKEREDYMFSIPNKSYRVKVKVQTSYKGKIEEGQIIELNSDFSNCSIYFESGGKYLLFLDKQNGKYLQRLCSYSERQTLSEKNIKIIEKETNYLPR